MELKPCPFCGGEAVEDTNEHRTMIECIAVGCVNPHTSYRFREVAALIWNTRADDARIADLERQLAEAQARSPSVEEAARVLLAALEADPSLEQAAPWRDWEEGWHCISALSGET